MVKKNPKGFTLIGVLIMAAVLGTSIALYGIITYYTGKAKSKAETKASVIDSEGSLVELVATKFKTAISVGCGNILSTNKDPFRTLIDNSVFSDNSVTLKLVMPPAPGTTIGGLPANAPQWKRDSIADILANAPQWMKDAINSCNATTTPNPFPSPNFPANSTTPGVYIFCVRIDSANEKNTTSFLFSELSFVQFRIELTSQSTPQNTKILGPALTCGVWNTPAQTPTDTKQLKVSYRILWKKPRGNSQEVFSQLGSKILNVAELKGS